MTPDDLVEAMARGIIAAGYNPATAHDITRVAIHALHERGGLVVARMPDALGPSFHMQTDDWGFYNKGYNDALAAVRAAAVEVK